MRHGIAAVLSKFGRPASGFTPSQRPVLEQLEDRCLPSSGMMMPMSMPMPPMGMQPMSMTTMSSPAMNPTLFSAVRQLVTDFGQTLHQVQTSTTVQQFVTNEIHMIQVLLMDLAQIRMLETPPGRMM
jgi:hypothetical protein